MAPASSFTPHLAVMKAFFRPRRILWIFSVPLVSSFWLSFPVDKARSDTLTDAMEAVIQYTAKLHGINFKYLLSDRPISTPCGLISLAAFCTIDNTVYVNVTEVKRISDNPLFPLYAVAHESGHAIQWNRGIGGMDEGGMSIGIELQADCFAGDTLSWMFSQAHQLTENEYINAGRLLASAASEVGDFEAPNKSHGTPTQRAEALTEGFYGKDHLVCTR